MLKAKELRVGNKFKSAFGNIETVLSIIDNTDKGKIKVITEEERKSGKLGFVSENHKLQYSHLILCEENGNQYKPFEIEPIELTDTLMVRLGWTKDGDYYNYGDWTILLKGSLPEHCGLFYNMKNNAQLFPKIKYVHQLQNLYFFLTGEELIFN